MQEAHPLPELLRFGIFELDLRAGELRKNGLRVRLQEQPFQVLAMLLERPGEIVGRQELQKKLWPADTFVDFDHGLNKAINKVREALGDSAESPRFVETIARRGYRFLADQILATDGFNPMTAARLVEPLGGWRRYKPELGALMKAELQRILAAPGLSKNVFELVSRALAEDEAA